MPAIDLRGIKLAEYINTNGTITYGTAQSAGDAMSVLLNLKFAEGRLYAESTLAEYVKKAVGGTISIAVKYLPSAVQQLLFGMTTKSRTVNTKSISSLVTGAKNVAKAVGVAFYAPDMIDGVEKYTCVFISRALFGAPALNYQTQGENIVFQTPTTTGEFMADHSSDQQMLEVAVCDTEADAKAWVNAVLGATGGST